ncbi:hypothetical protein ACMFMG_007592 [Clarireedia jacksonii]
MMHTQEIDNLFPSAANHIKELKSVQWLDLATLASTKPTYIHDALDLAVKSPSQHVFKPTKVARIEGSFSLFRNLPKEIQNKVWVMKALSHPRVITITEVNSSIYTVTGARRPRFLQTCKTALRAMIPLYKPLFAVHGSTKAVYVNVELDVVHLHSLGWYGNFPPKFTFQSALQRGADFQLIRHLCLDAAGFDEDFGKVAEIIRALPNLETVRVEEKFIDFDRDEDFFLMVQFEDQYLTCPNHVDGPRLEMSIKVKCPEGVLSGPAAVQAIFEEVTNQAYQARLLTTLGRVETMMRQENSFPANVIGQFNYLSVDK